ncbi:MAG: hypothetical protein PUB22_07810 [Clostridiales bacterium]|nr:hypothetical protein [Clostridiales bacterium]
MNGSQQNGNSPFDGMSPEKVQFLIQMMGQMKGKSSTDLLSFLLSAGSSAQKNGMDFSDQETQHILEILNPNMTPEEKKRIEMMRNLSRIIAMKNQKQP